LSQLVRMKSDFLYVKDFPRTPSPLFALQQQARQRHAAAAAAGFTFGDDPAMSTGDLDAMQKQYRDQLNALDYDDMILNGNNNNNSNRNRQTSNNSSQQQHQQQQQQQQQHEDYGLHMSMEDPRSSISPPLRNKFATSSTPPARSNSTPPGRNMYSDMDRQTEMMMNQFGGFGLNEEVKKKNFGFYDPCFVY
jgi:hypothetical protein